MISIAMQLGIAPMPEPKKKAKSTIHTADGKPPRAINRRGDRAEIITTRRMAILAICSHEAVSMSDLKDALEINESTLSADLRAMVDGGTLRMVRRNKGMRWEAA